MKLLFGLLWLFERGFACELGLVLMGLLLGWVDFQQLVNYRKIKEREFA